MKVAFAKILFVLLVILASSCNDNPDENPVFSDNFDRGQMLEFWADDIIIPAYTAYSNTLVELNSETVIFYSEPSVENLNTLRSAWLDSYLAWQQVSMFEIGRAEEIGLRNFTNIYPADKELIQANISSGDYNLELPSNFPTQGFPALDYLLYGQGNSDAEIVEALNDANVESYFTDLVERLHSLSSSVLEDWNQGFRNEFISNNGSSATASTDKMINDFLFYYERFLRAAKVGIPAGLFSGNVKPELVEGKYSNIYSKRLFEQGFSAVRNFFGGQSFDGSRQGISLEQYLNEIHEANNTEVNVASAILTQWENVNLALENVDDSFANQVLADNDIMLALHNEIQNAVVILKVEMLQALNIQVDFVDADGD